MKQWIDMLSRFLGLNKDDIGTVGHGTVDIKEITVAMIQTANRLPHELFTDFGIIIFDESHHLPANTCWDIAKRTKSKFIFGLSATQRREDGKELMLKGGVGDIIVNYTTSEMIQKGYLAKPTIIIEKVSPIPFSRRASYEEVYRDAVINNSERNDKIKAKAIEYHNQGKSVYIHVKRINHGKLLNSMIPGSVFIYGKDKLDYREVVINNFKNNGGVMISTLLGEGINIPKMDVLIFGTPYKSEIATRQVFGRVLRVTADKCRVTIVDFADKCNFLINHYNIRRKIYEGESEFEIKG